MRKKVLIDWLKEKEKLYNIEINWALYDSAINDRMSKLAFIKEILSFLEEEK